MKRKVLLCLAMSSLLTLGGLVSCGEETSSGLSTTSNQPTTSVPTEFTGTLKSGPDLNGEKGIAIRYTREDKNYANKGLWIWENNGGEGKEYEYTDVDDFGAVCFLPFSTWSENVEKNGLGVITKTLGTWDGQSKDMIVNFANFTQDDKGYYNVFIKDGDNNLFDNPNLKYIDGFTNVRFVNATRIITETTNDFTSLRLLENGVEIGTKSGFKSNYQAFDLTSAVDPTAKYEVEVTFAESNETMKTMVSKRGLFTTTEFDEAYYYNGELGALYTNEKTTFNVWSPLSTRIILRIYNSGTPKSVDSLNGDDSYNEYEMVKGEKGVFEYELSGDLEGKYYTFVVTNDVYENQEVVDPYAKSTGVNGLRGMVVDFSKTNPEGWENVSMHSYNRTELAVYETHIADVSSSSTWGGTASKAKKSGGMYEKGTTFTSGDTTVKTGFDHIKELGVNAVQILPFFDQANDEVNASFNWGYNPLNYNSLDGVYSSNPYDGYEKIKEFKELVKAYNEEGINIIMDVVYNHVNGATKSNFDVLMPEYYFRYSIDGTLSNGSGCGNETRSEVSMMRKFIKDSTEFWAKEYKLGGFRFDLMGLHDIQTMNEVTANLKEKIDENIFVHGEPWAGGTTPLLSSNAANQSNLSKFVGYGAFNDHLRDSLIKGGLSDKKDKGWATNPTEVSEADYAKLTSGILGRTSSYSSDPLKSTAYVTCHDNYTLYDRIVATGYEGSDESIAEMATLANSVVFTSQGTSFMLAGEEMLRTKDGDNNSYKSSYKVNELDYSRLITFEKVYENYKKLINLKTTFDGLQYKTSEDIKNNVTLAETAKGIIDYTVKGSNKTYRIIHAASGLSDTTIDLSNYNLVFATKDNGALSSSYKLTRNTTLVLEAK